MKISLSVAVLAFGVLGTQPLCAQSSSFGEDFGVPGTGGSALRGSEDPTHPIGYQSPAYAYNGTPGSFPDQTLGIVTNPFSGYGNSSLGNFGDHTYPLAPGTGYMLVVNGGTHVPGSGPYFYSHTVNSISAGTSFDVSFWARRAFTSTANPATLVLGYSVNGGTSFSFITPSNSLVSDGSAWTQSVANIPASALGGASSVMFALFDSNGNASANAFAVDDISITGVPESSTVFAGVAALGLVGLAFRQRQANRAVRPDAFACA